MEYLFIFGLIAFCLVLSLQSKVTKIERLLRDAGIGEKAETLAAEDLQASLQKRIGKTVKFDFYDDVIDSDLFGVKDCKILDVDEKWVLVHCENKKKSFDKLIRISTIRGIAEV